MKKKKFDKAKYDAPYPYETAEEMTARFEMLQGDSEFYGQSLAELLKDNHQDPVNHPQHYNFGKYEVIDVLEDWFATEPLLWQVGKYISRWDKKGDPIENLEKAEFYLKRKIAKLKEQQDA